MNRRLAAAAALGGLLMIAGTVWLAAAPAPRESAPAPAPRGDHVLVIRGTRFPPGPPQTELADGAFAAVSGALQLLGLPWRETTDEAVAHGREDLTVPAVIILPYNPALSPAQTNLLLRAVGEGVPLIAFGELSDRLRPLLGGGPPGPLHSAPEGGGLALRMDPDCLPGLPASIGLSPARWRATSPEGHSEVFAWWTGPPAAESLPAAVLSERGAFLGLTPSAEEASALGPVLWALLGRFAPQVVSAALPRDARHLPAEGSYPSLAHMLRAWRQGRAYAAPEGLRLAEQAEALVEEINALVAANRLTEAGARAAQARELARHAYWASFPSPDPEIRGVWAYPWADPDWPTAIAQMAQANLNAVFPYVASGAVAYYPSRALPRWTGSQRDYLAEAAQAAAGTPVELHPRTLGLSCLFGSEQTKRALAQQGRLMINDKGQTEDWLCPLHPRNRELLLAVAAEIVTRYPVQGLHLDYLRYPHDKSCLCARCRSSFEQHLGRRIARWPQEVLSGPTRRAFLDWRLTVLTELLREMRTHLRSVAPEAQLSAAVFPDWVRHPDSFGQEPAVWAAEGLVDFLAPMNYTRDLERFQQYVRVQQQQLQGRVPLAVGIGAFSDTQSLDTPHQVLDQVLAGRALGAQGYVIFNWNQRFADDYLPWMALGLTSRPAWPQWRRAAWPAAAEHPDEPHG